jgi:hypothetical protein
VSSQSLDVPVVESHGYSDFVWAQADPSVTSPNPSTWNAAYGFQSEIPITQFEIPDALPGGDSEFKIVFGQYESHTLQAGVPFVFTDYAPDGVTAFVVTGFNADEGLLAGEAFRRVPGHSPLIL